MGEAKSSYGHTTYEAEIASQVIFSEAANSRRLDLSGKAFRRVDGRRHKSSNPLQLRARAFPQEESLAVSGGG
jgi:hypothetical protein